MNAETNEHEFLTRRVSQLEREVARMRRLGTLAIGIFLLIIVVFRIGDHRRVSTDQVVTRDIIVNDSEGHARARMTIFPEGSGLEVFASSGERRVALLGRGEEATLNLYIPVTAYEEGASVNLFHNNTLYSSFRAGSDGGRLEMHSARANGSASMSLHGTTAMLTLSGADGGVPKVWLSANEDQACTALGGVSDASGSLCLHAPGLPTFELSDIAGNRAVIGIPSNPDLSTDQDSAASMILKHKSGRKVQVTPQ
ncbi:MAG TPA: hypothetical protein VMX38_11920 [Verrucomicrobiae bacterium]|jgi:hypothetical protein|nr:hypothetical protein [Verrucomicrobiae bacterium]